MFQVNPPSINICHAGGSEQVVSIEVASRDSAEEFKSKLKKRVRRLLKKKENKLCMDCNKPNPKWASLLVVPSANGRAEGPYASNFFIGGFCCLECSGAHRRLGTHLSFVRSVELDSLKENEVEALEVGGNTKVNSIFEGNLSSLKPDPTSGQKLREAFIREKYEKKRYLDIKELATFRQFMIHRNDDNMAEAMYSPLSGSASPASQPSPQLSPVQQLQIFTSSPRTLALIEKYMNPKPKKKGFKRIKFSFRRFSRKRNFKGDIRNIRGIVSTNPNLQVVETRSDYIPSPRSDVDDDESFTSAQSSMSAAIRRRLIHGGTPTNKWVKISSPKKKVAHTPTPRRKGCFTPTPRSSRSSDLTPTPTGRRRRFTFRQNYSHVDSEARRVATPSPASSTPDSSRFRFSSKLRTPRQTSSQKKKRGGDIFFADEGGLDVVKEADSNDASDAGNQGVGAEIKAMKAWSKRFDKIVSKVFNKKKSTSRTDEETLLGEGSGSSDSNKY